MKKILLGATAVAAFTSAAVAADLPSRRAPPVYAPPPAPIFTWSGPYFGFNVGADFNGYTNDRLFAGNAGAAGTLGAGVRAPFFDTRSTGFAGGGQIGYNFQIDGGGLFGNTFGALGSGLSPLFGGSYGGVVFGVEADIDGTTNRASGIYTDAGLTSSNYRSRTDFVGTVRGRIGYAFGNLLIFGTGGFAYADVRDSVVLNATTGAFLGSGAVNRIQTGYAYGGGVEYAIPTASVLNFFKSSAVTVKAEFIHYDLGGNQTTFATVGGNVYTLNTRNLGNIARIGVNYKFGTIAPTPVVARY